MKCCYFNKLKKKRINPTYKKTNSYTLDDKLSTDEFLKEVLCCGTCKKAFSLHENKLSALCGGCNKFLHCGIAGKCVGPNCGNSFHRLTWCINCIPKTIVINLQDLGPGKDCLCQECLDDPETPSCYKKKI